MQLWRPEFELDGIIQAVNITAYEYRYIIDYERETVQQLCAK